MWVCAHKHVNQCTRHARVSSILLLHSSIILCRFCASSILYKHFTYFVQGICAEDTEKNAFYTFFKAGDTYFTILTCKWAFYISIRTQRESSCLILSHNKDSVRDPWNSWTHLSLVYFLFLRNCIQLRYIIYIIRNS